MFQRFMTAVEKEYLPVPFHSFAHAVDVLHGVSRVLRCICSNSFLTELEESDAESEVEKGIGR